MAIEQRLRQSIIRLEGEETRLSSQTRDLKDAFVKMRDQRRVEQLAIESHLAVERQLRDELAQTRQEIKRMESTEAQLVEMHKQDLEALTATLTEEESRRMKEITRLKEELAKAVQDCVDRAARGAEPPNHFRPRKRRVGQNCSESTAFSAGCRIELHALSEFDTRAPPW